MYGTDTCIFFYLGGIMKVKVGSREFTLPDHTMVEPWLTVVEQDNVCRIVFSTAWDHPSELIEYLISIGITSNPLFVIPKIVCMTDTGKYVYHNAFMSIDSRTKPSTITLESELDSMDVGMRE